MKKNISESGFCREFEAYGRGDQFTPSGLRALYAYLCDLENDTGEELELDVIALCCDFCEYESAEAAAEDIGCEESEVRENTVAEHCNGIIIRNW